MAKLTESLKAGLVPVALIASSLAVLLGAVDSVTKIIYVAQSHFYALMALCYFVCLLGLWPRKSTARRAVADARRNKILLAVISLAFFAGVGYRYYEDHRTTYPARNPSEAPPGKGEGGAGNAARGDPPGQLGERETAARGYPRSVTSPNRQAGRPSKLVLEAFTLNDEMSSFGDSDSFLFAEGPRTYRTFAYNYYVSTAFREGTCLGDDEQPIREVLPLLRQRLTAAGQQNLVRRIESIEGLRTIMRDRGDLFEQVVFSPGELRKLEHDSPSDFKTVQTWLLKCIGLQQPVLTFTIANESEKSALLTDIIYHVDEVGQIMGDMSGPVFPQHTFDHALLHVPGPQSVQLKPPLRIAPGGSVTFNVRLFAAENEPGLAWLLSIEVLAADGGSVRTEPFQIIMAK